MTRQATRNFLLSALVVGLGGCGSSEPSPSGRLVIAEVLYRSGTDSLEWIEIANRGGAEAPLEGVSVSGAGYDFPAGVPALPPGRSVILANDPSLFAKHHPGVALFGTFPGRLDDQGEALRIVSGTAVLFDASYSAREPWPQGAALGGAALVYRDGDPRLASSWGASARRGGSPGGAHSIATDRKLHVAEVRPTDLEGNGFVEICSDEGSATDLGGWLLAESPESPLFLSIPVGTVLDAGACTVFHQDPGAGESGWGTLAPDRSGGKLVLFERSGDSLTGSAHGLSWGALPEGFSAIRLVDGASGLQSAPTPGVRDIAGSAPMVSIHRVCYHPSAGAEHLVLRNLSDSVIHLGASDSAHSWSMDGTGLRFGATDSLLPGGWMFLVASKDGGAAAFRAAHGIAASTPVLEYSGSLDNSGERIALLRPLVAVTSTGGKLRWAAQEVDVAQWLPAPPWPVSADGGGTCLQRTGAADPGDAASSWKAVANRPEVLQ
jgi:hypothetical protein